MHQSQRWPTTPSSSPSSLPSCLPACHLLVILCCSWFPASPPYCHLDATLMLLWCYLEATSPFEVVSVPCCLKVKAMLKEHLALYRAMTADPFHYVMFKTRHMGARWWWWYHAPIRNWVNDPSSDIDRAFNYESWERRDVAAVLVLVCLYTVHKRIGLRRKMTKLNICSIFLSSCCYSFSFHKKSCQRVSCKILHMP